MNDFSDHLVNLRSVMANFPSLDAHVPSAPIDVNEIYFPKSHAAALDPDRSLVIANRGMGKSFWASALVSPSARASIATALPESRLGQGDINVHFGFAEGEGAIGVSRDELAKYVASGAPVELIWRAITLPSIANIANESIPSTIEERLSWLANEPSRAREIMRSADANLSERQGKLLFVFDQLEQLADGLDQRSDLTQGILRLALAFKSYRALRVKIFMRPDHFAEDRLFAFPDASKVKGEALTLDWRGIDLYGLLYSRLQRSASNDFSAITAEANIQNVDNSRLTESLMVDEDCQHEVFDVIAGEAMGARKQGLPYTWLLSHLADARNQVSPRTFLRAIKYAAENQPSPSKSAIDYLGIHEGVRRASDNRLDDLKEDYPWVPPALQALKGLLVPCLPAEVIDKWHSSDNLIEHLRKAIPQVKQPAWMSATDESNAKPFEALLQSMADIGVIERRLTTGKVDVPDIFRLPAGIKRKGGITQQQRRKARITFNNQS